MDASFEEQPQALKEGMATLQEAVAEIELLIQEEESLDKA